MDSHLRNYPADATKEYHSRSCQLSTSFLQIFAKSTTSKSGVTRPVSLPPRAQRNRLTFRKMLREFRLYKSEILVGGGNRSLISRRIDEALYKKGWKEKGFNTSIRVDETDYPSPTHAIDCVKGAVALEMEWNNKDPFFDRDLNNFRLLFDLRAIQVGIIVTRSSGPPAVVQ